MTFAPFYKNFLNASQFTDLKLWQPSGATGPYIRGRIYTDAGTNFVVTGPKLQLCFGGCKYNKMVFFTTNDPEAVEFRNWIVALASSFGFDHDFLKQHEQYPEQLSMRLSSYKRTGEDTGTIDSDGLGDSIVDAYLFQVIDGEKVKIEPEDIPAGSFVIPVVRVGYYRHLGRTNLLMTVLQARVFPADVSPKIANEDWEMEIMEPMEEVV